MDQCRNGNGKKCKKFIVCWNSLVTKEKIKRKIIYARSKVGKRKGSGVVDFKGLNYLDFRQNYELYRNNFYGKVEVMKWSQLLFIHLFYITSKFMWEIQIPKFLSSLFLSYTKFVSSWLDNEKLCFLLHLK